MYRPGYQFFDLDAASAFALARTSASETDAPPLRFALVGCFHEGHDLDGLLGTDGRLARLEELGDLPAEVLVAAFFPDRNDAVGPEGNCAEPRPCSVGCRDRSLRVRLSRRR